MKNLHVLKRNLLQLHSRTLGFCIDADNGILYVVRQQLEVLKISTLEATQNPENVPHDLELAPELKNINENEIRLIEFIVESGCIVVALKNGLVLRIGVSSYSPPSGCLYKHSSQIASIRISPDQDLIALADDANDIHVIGIDGELLHKENALSQNDSLHKPVGVGWGSKETQFFGLDGRPSREKQSKDQVAPSPDEVDVISKIESSTEHKEFRSRRERNTVIDWRGDGQYLATLTFIPNAKKHYLKVWNRNLELQYMSEQLVTIERDILTWIPNGHFVCCAQRRDSIINEIAMFEKNGLVHQRISLPDNLRYIYVKDMIWSPGSRILAIVANQFYLDGDQVHFTPILLLYTMQNFHYYLKFTTKLSQDLHHTIRWNPINHNKLHVMSDDGSYNEYTLCFQVTYSEQGSTVAVIDSNKILVTPLQTSTIPPPMSALTLETESPIYSIAMNHHKATEMFILTFDDGLIFTSSNHNIDCDTVLKIQYDTHLPVLKLKSLKESYEGTRVRYRIKDVQELQNFIAVDGNGLVATRTLNNGCEIVSITLLEETIEACVKTLVNLDHQVLAVARGSEIDSKDIVLIQSDGMVVSLDSMNGKLKPLFQFGLNTKLNFIELQFLRSHDKIALISLSQDMNLSFNDDVVLSTSCTSFRITENYLIYTTTENHMQFLRLDRLWSEHTGETYSQPIETGATLIVASESEAKVVLQMPRGNLEVIHPRVLIFSALTRLLDSREFEKAIQVARRHRVNMNFICDYLIRMADSSMKSIKEFAYTVASYNPQLLSLFLTELDDEDTILGRYENIMEHLPERIVLVGQKLSKLEQGKVQQVCSTIELPNDQKYLQPKLLSLLKQTPKKTSEALSTVHKLDKHFHREALEFMLYFIDVDQLFLDALRTYDTDIALMVASVSHKDPKEYLALLDKFNAEKNDLLRAFSIDMHTKHYGDAFAKLLEYHDSHYGCHQSVETHNQLKEIATSKRIFKQALSCFRSDTKDQKLCEELWSDYGSYLLEKRYYLEAAVAFSKALELNTSETDYFTKALNCFSLANSSENALALIPKLTKKECRIESVITRLLEEEKGPEAMSLFTTYRLKSKDWEADFFSENAETEEVCLKYAKKLCGKGHWYLADYIFSEYVCYGGAIRELIKSQIIDTVLNKISDWIEEMSSMQKYFNRLKELLRTYKSRSVSEHTNSNACFISDSLSTVDGSEISSTLSSSGDQGPAKSGASSIKTRNSSKSNKSRAQKKKRINLKSGSRHEDLALALELRKYIMRHRSDEYDTTRLSAALFEYCYSTKLPVSNHQARHNSKRLNDLLAQHFHLRQEMSSLLWPDSPMNEQSFSLYRRFSNLLSDEGHVYENEEFEALMRPNLPKELARFEL